MFGFLSSGLLARRLTLALASALGLSHAAGADAPSEPVRVKVFIAAMFEFPSAIRKAIYTTNAIESVNSVIRKFTRNRKQYPNAASAIKLVYLAIHEASRRWTHPIKTWKAALNHFAILFEDRLPKSDQNCAA